jgi:hypothetical protein
MLDNRPLSFADISPSISKHFRVNSQNVGKTSKSSVLILSFSILKSVLQNPGFLRFFRISRQFHWPSVAPMQLGASRLRRCISRRAPKIESFFALRESPKHWGGIARSVNDPRQKRR